MLIAVAFAYFGSDEGKKYAGAFFSFIKSIHNSRTWVLVEKVAKTAIFIPLFVPLWVEIIW